MKRITIDGSDGHWFDFDTADEFEESTRWDGNNSISVNTGSQWSHESLFRTAGGNWVLCTWAQADGRGTSYHEIWDREAVAWLIRNEEEVPEDLQEVAVDLEVK